MKIRLNSILKSSYANGPGNRFVLWTQGCNLSCPECFNPDTHSFEGGFDVPIDDLIFQIKSEKEIQGVTISGGEPMLQAKSLCELLRRIKSETKLSVLIFSGFDYGEIIEDIHKKKVLEYTDILIAGRYVSNLQCDKPLISSSNQKIHFLTDRYSISDLPDIDGEIVIGTDSKIVLSGVRPLKIES